MNYSTRSGFAGEYPLVINTVIVAMIVIFFAIIWIAFQYLQKKKTAAVKLTQQV